MTNAADRLYEQILVTRCQAGDDDAFAELVGRFGPRLRYYLRRMLGPAADADDVLQDVWLDAYRALPRLNEPRALSAWLYRIARDRACRFWRRSAPEARPLAEANGVPQEEADTFSAEDAAAIHRALGELGAEHREVLVLRFMEDMSYGDLARVIGCPLGTVRSRLHHAKQSLRKLLERGSSHE